MTFSQFAIQYLTDRGMFDDQAHAVLDLFKADFSVKSMAGRWEDDVHGYPPAVLVGLAMNLDRLALSWIDANLPQAWYRSMFDPRQAEQLGIR